MICLKIISLISAFENCNNLKDIIINNLSTENDSFKNNKEIKKRNELIDNQKKIISEQKKTIRSKDKEISRLNGIINMLANNIDSLKVKLDKEIDKWKNRFWKMCSAIDKLLDKEPSSYTDHYEDLANAIKYDYYFNRKHKKKNDIDRSIQGGGNISLYQNKKTKKWAYRLSSTNPATGKRIQKHSKWYDLKKMQKKLNKNI